MWALGVGGVAWVVSGLVSVGLVLALRGLIPMPPWLWVLARGLLIASWVCFGGTVVLLAMGLSGRFRELVASVVLLVRGLTLGPRSRFCLRRAGTMCVYCDKAKSFLAKIWPWIAVVIVFLLGLIFIWLAEKTYDQDNMLVIFTGISVIGAMIMGLGSWPSKATEKPQEARKRGCIFVGLLLIFEGFLGQMVSYLGWDDTVKPLLLVMAIYVVLAFGLGLYERAQSRGRKAVIVIISLILAIGLGVLVFCLLSSVLAPPVKG